MIKLKFSNVKELIERAVYDKACPDGIQWASRYDNLDDLIRECPLNYRLWAIEKGYIQFVDNCEFDKITGQDWAELLVLQPELSEYCRWHTLLGHHWVYLLMRRPELSKYCRWETLSGADWAHLLIYRSQFSQYCDWEKLDNDDWAYLLKHRPKFYTKYDEYHKHK